MTSADLRKISPIQASPWKRHWSREVHTPKTRYMEGCIEVSQVRTLSTQLPTTNSIFQGGQIGKPSGFDPEDCRFESYLWNNMHKSAHWEYNSVWSEQLPFKEIAVGSNPTIPTINDRHRDVFVD